MKMARRRFLMGTVATIGLMAGCLAEAEERAITESITVDGFVVTVDDFLTAPRLEEAESYESGEAILPPPGAAFLLVHVVFENQSDTQKELPLSSETELMYSEEETPLSDVDYEDRVAYGGTEYSVYRYNYIDAEAVFPGESFDGWLIYTVPEDFQSSKAVLEIEIESGDEDLMGKWMLK